jgi:Transmembrane protein 43
MYQWKEEKKEDTQNNVGGGTTTTTTYDYSRVWSDKPINSSEFKHPENHDNPEMPFRNAQFTASDAKLGGCAWRRGQTQKRPLAPAITVKSPSTRLILTIRRI